MQVVDNNGNVFGGGLQVNGPDGKPKTSSGGGSPSGPAGRDLSGTYPNPGVVWSNGTPTYDLQYYPLSLNPAGYLNSISGSMVTSALGYMPYDASNPAGYIDSSALGPYLTAATAASTYQPILISSTNIKTINGESILGSGDIIIQGGGGSSNPTTISSINGTGISGLVNTISATVLIPANTIISTNTIYIKAFINRTVVSGSGATTLRFYTNTSNSLTGATFLGSGAAMATTVRFQRFERNIFFDGTNLNCFLTGTSSATDYTASGISLIGFNPAVDNYLLFAVQHSTSATDIAAWKKVIVQLYE